MASTKLPNMARLEVKSEIRSSDNKAILSLRLENQEDADIFSLFCNDIITIVSEAPTEIAAVQAFLNRTWKWHALLKGARKPTLSRELQLGIIGELHTLLNDIARAKGFGTALEAWRGSERAPKDFELAHLCIECKSRGASTRSKVRITSEDQLDDVPGHALILLVHTFASVDKDEVGAKNLHHLVADLRTAIISNVPSSTNMLEQKLDEAGYADVHEYDVFVLHRDKEAFFVEDGFPRIVPGKYLEGLLDITYNVSLEKIAPFKLSDNEFEQLLAT